METLEEMQWSVVWQEDASETDGEGVHNGRQTSSVVWGRDLLTKSMVKLRYSHYWDQPVNNIVNTFKAMLFQKQPLKFAANQDTINRYDYAMTPSKYVPIK